MAAGCFQAAQDALAYMPSEASEITEEEEICSPSPRRRERQKPAADSVSAEEVEEGSGSGSGSEVSEEESDESGEEGDESSSSSHEPFLEHAREGMKRALSDLFHSQVETHGQTPDLAYEQLRALSTYHLRKAQPQVSKQ